MRPQINWGLVKKDDGQVFPQLFEKREEARFCRELRALPEEWRIARVVVREAVKS